MKIFPAAAVLAALAGATTVRAFETTHIDVKARVYGSGDPWSDTLTLQSSNLVDPIVVEVGSFCYFGTGYGMATALHSLTGSPYSAVDGDAVTILDDNPTSTLHPDGRRGNFNFGGQFQVVYHTGTSGVDANRFRIGANGNAADNAAGGVSAKQGTPVALGTNFDTTNGVLVYHFKLSLACYNGGAERTITLDAPKAKISSFTVYANSGSSTATNIISTLLATDTATLTVSWAPAPASLGLFGAGAVIACRRRRV